MTRLTVANNGHRGKAFKVRGGIAVVPAGEKATIDDAAPLSNAMIEALAADNCKVHQSQDHDDAGLAGHTVAELKSIAQDENIDLGDATKKDDIIAAIELAREERA